jgi:hypothetical protein
MPETTAKRPLSVTLIAWLFIITGAGGFVSRVSRFDTSKPFDYDILWPCGLSVLAVVGGAFMLRGANRARWLCLVWMACHVVISAFHSISEVAVHSLIFAVLLYFLLRPGATAYFMCRRNPLPTPAKTVP